MKRGLGRFNYFLDKLESLLLQASTDKNPALWLYTNNARATVFMLEGLSKLYAGMHDRKRYEKIKIHFKLLEDAIGIIDYYSAFSKEFKDNDNVPLEVKEYIQGQTREKIQSLNDMLIDNKWIGEATRLQKIRHQLEKAEWLKEKAELKAIAGFYGDSIVEINVFSDEKNFIFSNIENQVHELRRKLRWLSIYPQALRGAIQLIDTSPADPAVLKYLTDEIVQSPFNQMVESGDASYNLLLEKNYFLALSWIIDALGKLKDRGLRFVAVAEAIQQNEGLSPDQSIGKAYKMLGEPADSIPKVLAEASEIARRFFHEKNLEKMLHSIAPVQS